MTVKELRELLAPYADDTWIDVLDGTKLLSLFALTNREARLAACESPDEWAAIAHALQTVAETSLLLLVSHYA